MADARTYEVGDPTATQLRVWKLCVTGIPLYAGFTIGAVVSFYDIQNSFMWKQFCD
jgi:hypothetical protein